MYRVMYICSEAVIGGAARSMIEMLGVFDKDKIKPYVIIPGSGTLMEKLQEMGVFYQIVTFNRSVYNLGTVKPLSEDAFKSDYETAQEIAKIVREQNIDIIHTNSSVCNVGALTATLCEVPHIWHIREFREDDYALSYIDSEFQIQLFNNTDKFITISKSVYEDMLTKYHINSEMIYDGIDIDKYINCGNEKRKNIKFLLAGNIVIGKGQIDAIKAAEILIQKELTGFSLDIVGAGDPVYLWYIERYIRTHHLQEYVHIYSFKENLNLLRKNYEAAIICSNKEALGRITLEAMLAENIVIGAATAGTLEIIGEKAERGLLYEFGDFEDLATQMQKVILYTEEYRNEFCMVAKEYVIQNFDIVNYGEKIFDVYKGVIDKFNPEKSSCFRKQLKYKYENVENKTQIIPKAKKIYEVPEVRGKGNAIRKKLEDRDVKIVALYGMGIIGCELFDELSDTEMVIKCVMDKKYKLLCQYMEIDIKAPDEELGYVDAVIITVKTEVDELVEYYKNKVKNVFTIRDLVSD